MVSVARKSDDATHISADGWIAKAVDVPLYDLVVWLLICGCSFLNLTNFLVDKNTVGLDPQVLAKLGLIGMGGLYGLHGILTRPRAFKILTSFPVAWVLILASFYLIAVPFSPSPRNALVSSCTIIAVLLMMVTALDHLGVMKVVEAIFWGMGLFVIGSWFAYLVFPTIGVFAEPISNGGFKYRMSGLAHPNTLGQYSALTVVLSVVLLFSYKKRNFFIIVVAILALGALVNSYSRSSLLACVLSLLVGYRHIYFRKQFLGTYLLIATVGLLGLMVLSTQIDLGDTIASKLTLLSKSDDTEELTTATGRSTIWAHAITLIQERPVTGYGASTQKYYFEDHSLYTHNMLLNITFSAGIFAGIAALVMILGRLRALFIYRHPLSDAIVVFIIINGLFENVIFSILAGLPTMLWILALAWPLLTSDPTVRQLSRSKLEPDSYSRYLRLESS